MNKQLEIPEEPVSVENIDKNVEVDYMATELRDENVETATMTNEDKGYVDILDSPASLCTVQNARSMAEYVECRIPCDLFISKND